MKTNSQFSIKKIVLSCGLLGLCSVSSFAYCEDYKGQTLYGFKDGGACWAYYCTNGVPTWLGAVSSSNCCTVGLVQYKSDGECSTIARTCCSGTWSAWGGECETNSAQDCSSSQCWNGYGCTEKPTGKQYDGKCFYTCSSWQCNKGSGWTCASKYYEKEQKGQWTVWGDNDYSRPATSTCSGRAVSYMVPSSYGPTDEVATAVCKKHINGMQGTPDDISTWTGSCTIIGNCWCVNYSGGASSNCNEGRYKCQTRTVSCTEVAKC